MPRPSAPAVQRAADPPGLQEGQGPLPQRMAPAARSCPCLAEAGGTPSPTKAAISKASDKQPQQRTDFLFLLLLRVRIRVSQRLDFLPLLARLERVPDWRQQTDDPVRNRRLEVLWVYLLLRKGLFDVIVVAEVHIPAVLLLPADREDRALRGSWERKWPLVTLGNLTFLAIRSRLSLLSFYAQLADWYQHGLGEGEKTVIGDIALFTEGTLDLLAHDLRWIEEVYFRVRVRRRHLSASETGNHGVHQVGTLHVAESGQVELRERKDFALHRVYWSAAVK